MNSKKFAFRAIATLLCLVMLIGMIPVYVAADTEYVVEIGNVTIDKNTTEAVDGYYTVSVPINLTTSAGLMNFSADVTYDEALDLTGWTENGDVFMYIEDILSYNLSSTIAADLETNPYRVYISAPTVKKQFYTTGELMALTFKVPENVAAGDYPISIEVDSLLWQDDNQATKPTTEKKSVTTTVAGGIKVVGKADEEPLAIAKGKDVKFAFRRYDSMYTEFGFNGAVTYNTYTFNANGDTYTITSKDNDTVLTDAEYAYQPDTGYFKFKEANGGNWGAGANTIIRAFVNLPVEEGANYLKVAYGTNATNGVSDTGNVIVITDKGNVTYDVALKNFTDVGYFVLDMTTLPADAKNIRAISLDPWKSGKAIASNSQFVFQYAATFEKLESAEAYTVRPVSVAEYTVKYNTVEGATVWYEHNTQLTETKEVTYKAGENIYLRVQVEDGYIFKGWKNGNEAITPIASNYIWKGAYVRVINPDGSTNSTYVPYNPSVFTVNGNIDLIPVVVDKNATVPVTFMANGEVFTTVNALIGDTIVYPETTPKVANKKFVGWDVAEGTEIEGETTVNAIFEDIAAPVGVAYGRDMKFGFNRYDTMHTFYAFNGATVHASYDFNANGDAYTVTSTEKVSILTEPENAYQPDTGYWQFQERNNGNWGPGDAYIRAYVNLPATNFIQVGYAVKAGAGVNPNGIVVETDKGNITVPATYTNTGNFTTLVLDMTGLLPEGAKNIRAIKFEPWISGKNVSSGSKFVYGYAAAFENKEDAEAYALPAATPAAQYTVKYNTVEGATVWYEYSTQLTGTKEVTYKAGENIYLRVQVEDGYIFKGWKNGNEAITPIASNYIWKGAYVRVINPDGSTNSTYVPYNPSVFTVNGNIDLIPVVVDKNATVPVTFMANGEVFTTVNALIGDTIVYPETTPKVANKKFVGWDVAEGTEIEGETTVNAIFTDSAAPLAVAYGRDTKFALGRYDAIHTEFGMNGAIVYADYEFSANGDTYTVVSKENDTVLIDAENAYQPDTGYFQFTERNSGNWGPSDNTAFKTFVNLPATAKYIKLGYAVKASAGVNPNGIKVITDAGDIIVPATYANNAGFTTLVLDVTGIPEGAKNIRALVLDPWVRGKNIASGSTFTFGYAAAFETLEDAEAYAPAAATPAAQYTVKYNTVEGATVWYEYNTQLAATKEVTYKAGENIYVRVQVEDGYIFKGWKNGDETIVPVSDSFIWKGAWINPTRNNGVGYNPSVFTVNGNIDLIPVVIDKNATVPVTFMVGDEEYATLNVIIGEGLVYPETAPKGSNNKKFVGWDVPESTAVEEAITVNAIFADSAAPLAVANGRDMKFAFRRYDSMYTEFAFNGAVTYNTYAFDANGDAYTITSKDNDIVLTDAEYAYQPDTGYFQFKEANGGNWGAGDNTVIKAFVNFPATTKYIQIGYSLSAGNGAGTNGVRVITDAGDVTVPATYENKAGFKTLVLDVTELPEGAKNIRALALDPWMSGKAITSGSTFVYGYAAAFETLEDAEAYAPAAATPAAQYTVKYNTVEGATVWYEYNTQLAATKEVTYKAGENIYVRVQVEDGYIFKGWKNGNEAITPIASNYIWKGAYVRVINPDGSTNNTHAPYNPSVFTVNGDIDLIPVVELEVQPVKVKATATNGGKLAVNGGNATDSYTADINPGTELTFVATADAGYKLDGWYNITNGKNILLSNDATYVLTVGEADVTIEARFMDETISIVSKLAVETDGNGKVSVDGGEAVENYFDYANGGDNVALTPVANEGYVFAYWTRKSADGTEAFIDAEAEVEVAPLGAEVAYVANFVAEGETATLYVDAQEIVLSKTEEPAVPGRLGYVAGEWKEYVAVENVIVYKPTYVRADTTYTLTITYADGSVDTVEFKYDEGVAVIGKADSSVWTLTVGEGEPIVISYESEFVLGTAFTTDATLVEAENTEEAQAIVNAISAVYDAGANQIKFTATFELPEGATLVERGVLLTSDASVAAEMEIGTAGVIVGKIKKPVDNATKVFIINKSNVAAGATWYGRPYIIYTANGVTETLYATTISATAE